MMFAVPARRAAALLLVAGLLPLSHAQEDKKSRHYKPLPPTAPVVITVEKGFNNKPLPNAPVVFRAIRDGRTNGVFETKTDPDGRATLDLLEVGSHVTVQVLARGYSTFATDFDLTGDGKQILVKLQRPREQVSGYGEENDRPADVRPGTQEHLAPKPAGPTTATPAPVAPRQPLPTPPPVNSPETRPTTTPPATSPATPPDSLR